MQSWHTLIKDNKILNFATMQTPSVRSQRIINFQTFGDANIQAVLFVY